MKTTDPALNPTLTRRGLITGMASGLLLPPATAFAQELSRKPGAFAEELTRTAWVEEGPFYPYRNLPLDSDNDLIVVKNDTTPAVGEITNITGRLLDVRGNPLRNATVEIWQVDSTATYLAERERGGNYDTHFQGFGRFLTDSTGGYRFRTIKPVPYHSRPAPHIHFKITAKGQRPFTTQLYVKGHPGNRRDGVYNRIGDEKAVKTVTADFAPVKGSRIGELAARFDIVLGRTLEDDH